MKVHFITILFLSFLAFDVNGQSQKLPGLDEINLNTPEDHIEFQDNILNYIEWLENNNLRNKNRKAVNAVFLKWIIHTPAVRITLDDYIRDYVKKNEGLLTLFMAGYSKYILNNPTDKSNHFAGNLAGINTMLDYYSKGKKMNVKKDKKVEELLRIKEAGLLNQFLEKHLK